MNKSKILAATGLATVMSATAASADSVSVNGYIEGWFTSGDSTVGLANAVTSQSVYVAYSTTMDNGMGLSVGFTLTNGSHSAGFSVDTGMGTRRVPAFANSVAFSALELLLVLPTSFTVVRLVSHRSHA
jgi:hypothetical protein